MKLRSSPLTQIFVLKVFWKLLNNQIKRKKITGAANNSENKISFKDFLPDLATNLGHSITLSTKYIMY